MKSIALERIAPFRHLLQRELFPFLESALGPLSQQGKLLAWVVSWEPLAGFLEAHRAGTGRPRCDRQCLATAFLAKAVYNLTTTRQLIERLHSDAQLRRLCGWNSAHRIPAEATFSRAFAEFAITGLPARIHEALVRKNLEGCVIDYIARDSTAIEAREHLPADRQPQQRRRQKAEAAPATRKKDRYQRYPGRRRGAKPGLAPSACAGVAT